MRTILVIDDDTQLLERIQTALRAQGFETLIATSSETGVELARRHRPALILCDVNMDGGDGYAALKLLREDSATAATPFILMTGNADYRGMRRGMDQGADDYLAKPFRMEALFASVQARLKKGGVLTRHSERKLVELRAQITSIVPHELKTPLTGILEFADLLRTQVDSLSTTEIATMSQHIHSSALRLHRLIENNILFSQLFMHATGTQEQEREESSWTSESTEDAAALITSVARRMADRHERMIEFNAVSPTSTVAMAPEYLSKVVEELLDNAFKFSNSDSSVRLRIEASPAQVIFSVRDNGRGMSPEQVANIGAYVQFDRPLHEQQGAGLGLALVAKLVQIHGGKFSIRNNVPQGTAVTVTLPSSPAHSAPTAESGVGTAE